MGQISKSLGITGKPVDEQLLAMQKIDPEIYSWENISAFFPCSEAFLRKHKAEIFWKYASHGQHLSEALIEEVAKDKHQNLNADKSKCLDWDNITYYQYRHLSHDFLLRHRYQLDFEYLYAVNKKLRDNRNDNDPDCTICKDAQGMSYIPLSCALNSMRVVRQNAKSNNTVKLATSSAPRRDPVQYVCEICGCDIWL